MYFNYHSKVKKVIENDELYVFASKYNGRMNWLSVLLDDQRIFIDGMTDVSITIEKWLEEKEEKYYLAFYKDYKEITEDNKFLEQTNEKYKIIYNDEYGFILERK